MLKYLKYFFLSMIIVVNFENCISKRDNNKSLINNESIFELLQLKIKLEEAIYTNKDKKLQDSIKIEFIKNWTICKCQRKISITNIESICKDCDNQLFQVNYISPLSSKLSSNAFLTCQKFKIYINKILNVKDDSILINEYIVPNNHNY